MALSQALFQANLEIRKKLIKNLCSAILILTFLGKAGGYNCMHFEDCFLYWSTERCGKDLNVSGPALVGINENITKSNKICSKWLFIKEKTVFSFIHCIQCIQTRNPHFIWLWSYTEHFFSSKQKKNSFHHIFDNEFLYESLFII